MLVNSKSAKTLLEIFGAALGFFALGVQLNITVHHYLADGLSFTAAFIRYLGFFTILTNSTVALLFTASALQARKGMAAWLQKTSVKSAFVVYIIVVGVVYNTMLRHLWHPEGLAKVADTILHQVIPLLYVTYWLSFVEKGRLSSRAPWRWLAFPLLYFGYVLIQGQLVEFYPYPFVNVTKLGLERVLVNSALLTLAFLVLGFLVFGLDRSVGRLTKTSRNS